MILSYQKDHGDEQFQESELDIGEDLVNLFQAQDDLTACLELDQSEKN